MSAFLRQCFLSWSDGSPCEYTAPSKRAFKRHLETKHQVKLSVRGRGPSAREVFTPLTVTERALSRINVSNRQGGRGPDRARLREELGFPAPPRPCSNPPTERVGELLSSRAPQGYLPEGYRSPASDLTSSSLSLGGLTNDVDADLDEIDLSGAMELAGPSDTWMASLPDLATVATVGLDANMQRSPTPPTGRCRMYQLNRRRRRFSRRRRRPSQLRRRRWHRRRRMRPRPPALCLHRYCRRLPSRLSNWRAVWNSRSTPTPWRQPTPFSTMCGVLSWRSCRHRK